MPWVRLHGTKDYWGMALHLEEVPEMRCTINLVPSLLAQLQAYTERGPQDEHLRVSRLPADGLSEADRLLPARQLLHGQSGPDDPAVSALSASCTSSAAWRSIRPRGRCARFSHARPARPAGLVNLTWMHPLAFERDAELAEFRAKGRHWTEDEKAVAARQAAGAAAPRSSRCTASWPSAARSS